MPPAEVRVYCNADRSCPLIDQLDVLEGKEPRAHAKCLHLITVLEQLGREIHMPYSKPLRDGVFELRGKVGTVNHRILYGYIGRDVALLSHHLTKEADVPDADIDLAVKRIELAKKYPDKHIKDFEEDDEDEENDGAHEKFR